MLHDHQFVSSVTKQLNKAQQTPYINKTTHWQLLRQLASVCPGLTPFVSSHVYVTSLVCAHRTRSTNHINPVRHIDRPHQGQRNVNSIKQTLKKLFCLQLFTWESCTYNKQKKLINKKKKSDTDSFHSLVKASLDFFFWWCVLRYIAVYMQICSQITSASGLSNHNLDCLDLN